MGERRESLDSANYSNMQLASSTKYFCLICLPGSLVYAYKVWPYTPLIDIVQEVTWQLVSTSEPVLTCYLTLYSYICNSTIQYVVYIIYDIPNPVYTSWSSPIKHHRSVTHHHRQLGNYESPCLLKVSFRMYVHTHI